MLLTITTTHVPATDLGYLLGKHPDRAQAFTLSFGRAHVFYPEASAERCTAALLLELDGVSLVRDAEAAEHYITDRPWVASSLLSVALGRVFRSAIAGTCPDRPELVDRALPLEATIAALPCRGGEVFLRRLFEPLGYALTVENEPLAGDLGPSRYFTVTLRATTRLSLLLSHLYVLIPVLDAQKHYWIGEDEVAKLLRHGEDGRWLADHPLREQIVERYLSRDRRLVRSALAQLTDGEAPPDPEVRPTRPSDVEAPLRLDEVRIGAVLDRLRAAGARHVLDLGCGEAKLVRALAADPQFERILGIEVSTTALEMAGRRLERLSEAQRARVTLAQGALGYRDQRLVGFDAAAVVEVIEHLDPSRLEAFTAALLGHARPRVVLITTPNADYNVLFPNMTGLRHPDHRFEWTRAEFGAWATAAAEAHGYTVTFHPIGAVHPEYGAPTQLAELRR